ncbi:hypothetical protein BDW62DRAFT_198439 [Aspergillus aurantiobrunneus]
MKASVITALTWAACTMAGPIALNGHQATNGEDCTCEVETITITVPAPTETGAVSEPATTPCTETETATVTATEPETEETNTVTGTSIVTEISTVTNTATEINTAPAPPITSNTVTATGTSTAPPTSTPTPGGCENGRCHGTGHLLHDLGPQVNRLLTVTGADGEDFLVQVNEDVYNLLSGRVSLSDSVGEIIGDAASLGDLIADLGPIVDCILTIVGEDSRILLVRLAPEIADLLRGAGTTLGLDTVNNPVGSIVQSLGVNLKREVQHNRFSVRGQDGENIVVELTGAVGDLLHDLNLAGIVGTVIDVATNVPELIKGLGPDAEGLLVVLGRDGGALLIRLSAEVAEVVNGRLPELGTPLGNVVAVVGDSL